MLVFWLTTALAAPPAGFVDLSEHIPGLQEDIRYAGENNFTGAVLPGYEAADAWLVTAAADALSKVQADLAKEGLGLLIYDAYRPVPGTLGMVAWTERTNQENLLTDGYIARRSGHNHGHTVDLTLVRLETGEPLNMGTPFDTFSEASHTANATGDALANRLRLKAAMEAHGFRNYAKEWWHYRLPVEGTTPHHEPYTEAVESK